MLEQAQKREAGAEAQNRRRMLLALALLLAAVTVMMIRNNGIWSSGDEAAASDEAAYPAAAPAPQVPSLSEQTAAASTPAQATNHGKSSKVVPQTAGGASVVISNRAVVAPLAAELVVDGTKRPVRPSANSVKVDMQSDAVVPTRNQFAPATNALQRASLTIEKAPAYPLLAGRTDVQGAVLLQALIGADGAIRQLQVISGPTILSSAARTAALQWRFKPYLQNGKAVETQARITVNFVIKVSDDKAREGQDAHKHSFPPNWQPAHPGE